MKVQPKTDWPWDVSLDAVIAAPKSHKIVLENETVRVVEVVLQPGQREPVHTHQWPSVMMVQTSARIRYFDHEGAATD